MRPLSRRFAAAVLILPALSLVAPGCGRKSPLAPLPSETGGGGAVVAGTAAIAGGARAAGIAVVLEPVVEGLPLSVARRLEAFGARRPRALAATLDARTTVTDANGRFSFASVGAGQYLLRGSLNHHRAGSAAVQVMETAADTTFVELALVPVGKVAGSATLEGQAAGAHHSTIVSVDGASSVAVTDPAGAFLLEDVPIGTRTVRASHWSYRTVTRVATLAAAGDSIAVTPMLLLRDTNIPPVANASAAAGGNTLQPFALGGGGTDDDGAVVLYEWDFEDDGTFDWSSVSGAAVTHAYTTPGVRRAKLRVTDDQGAVAYDAVTFLVHDAYHVSPTGNDANDGTPTSPFRTIGFAISASQANGSIPLRVALGTYAEAVTFANGVSITGGYDATTWTRSTGSRSVIHAGTSSCMAQGLTSAAFVGLELRASDATAPSGNSIALVLFNCGNGVTFTDCAFISGKGANGAAGAHGASGAAGGGYNGGWAGSGGTAGHVDGYPGGPGQGPSGGSAGAGGNGNCANGSNGTAGGPGSTGAHGAAAQAGGSVSATAWFPYNGNNGLNGSDGSGGGGGGGEAYCQGLSGSSGGSGGAGGGGGQGGTGGRGGGASFAALLTGTGGPAPTFNGCAFTAGAAGNGGSGGNAGLGGAGVNGFPSYPGGGDGGVGGTGGAAGAGSGGPGGYSYAVLAKSTTPTFSGCTFNAGPAGAGGAGGYRVLPTFSAPSGPAGAFGAVWILP